LIRIRTVFTRRWVPELASIPLPFLQEPWRLDASNLAKAGVILGESYPAPIIDHIVAARRAKERITDIRKAAGYRQDAATVFQRHGSRKRSISNDNPAKKRAQTAKAKAASKQLSFDL
jgi:deoxyribodipyrimidine photo-lyase